MGSRDSTEAQLWERVIATLHEVEGGLVRHPSDPGGVTKYGISQRAYPMLDIPSLTREQAAALAWRDYWALVPAALPAGARWFVFDSAFHHGVSRALAWVGEQAVRPAFVTLPMLVARRMRFMTSLGTWSTFGRGWMNRIATVLAAIDEYERTVGRVTRTGTLVLHDLRFADAVAIAFRRSSGLAGEFVVRERTGRVDVRREA